jgi:hypothetical protein
MDGRQGEAEKEPRLKWQDAFGLVGVFLAIGGMADMPLPLRLLFFLACAICLPISFASHKTWPLWSRWVLSFLVVVLMGAMSWYAWKKAYEITTQAQISVTKTVGFFEAKKDTGQEGFGVNIYYRNSGTGPTEGGVTHRAILATTRESNLSDDEIRKAQADARRVVFTPNNTREIEANSGELFFTAPDEKDALQASTEAHEVLAGNEKLYLFVAFKYRDNSLEKNMARLTESCRWAEGNF